MELKASPPPVDPPAAEEMEPELGSGICWMRLEMEGIWDHLFEKIERALDHVLDGRNRRDVGLIAARGVHHVEHVFGGIDAWENAVAVRVGAGMVWRVSLLRVTLVDRNACHFGALPFERRLKLTGEG